MKSFISIIGFASLFLAPLIQAKRPNILFAIADDMSHASVYGHRFLSTPHFDSIAGEGLLFTRMYTPSSKCAPSRAVILTGRNPWQLEQLANHKPVWPENDYKTFVETLTDHGYFSGFTGKSWNPGIHPKGRDLVGKEYNQLKLANVPTKSINKFDYTGNFKQFLADKPKDQPFFFWYGCKEPHRGYEFKSGAKHGKSLHDLEFTPSFWGEHEAVKHDILDYAFEVEYFDQHLGQILAHLAEQGELENTFIIATSDNSMPFPRYKGHPHEFATRVPFAVKWPGQIKNPGRTCTEFASFIDLAPTILEIAGIDESKSGMKKPQGQSLTDFFQENVSGRDFILTGRERNDMCRPNAWGYPVRSLHLRDYVYMHNFEPDRWPCGTKEAGFRDTDWSPTKSQTISLGPDTEEYQLCYGKRPQEELYQVTTDPECLNNLATLPEHAKLKKTMQDQLFAKLKSQGDPRALGNGQVFDQYGAARRGPEYDQLVQQHSKKDKK